MSTFTPGPWRVVIADTGGTFSGWPSIDAPAADVSVVHRAGFKQDFWGGPPLSEALANARLIAAAPDLLAALKCLLKINDERSVADALAAIAKASEAS